MSKFGHSPYTYCLICAWWIPKFGYWRPNAQGKTGFCSGQCIQANGRSRTVYIWHNFGTFFTDWVIENFCQNWGKMRKWNLSKEHWMTFYKPLQMNKLSRGARGPQHPTAFSIKFLWGELQMVASSAEKPSCEEQNMWKFQTKEDHWSGQIMICCMEDWTALYTLFCSLKSIQYWWKGA